MEFIVGQAATNVLQVLDQNGKPISYSFAAPPVWTSSDSTIMSVVAAPDGLSAVLTALTPGSAAVTVAPNSPTDNFLTPSTVNDTVIPVVAKATALSQKEGTPA